MALEPEHHVVIVGGGFGGLYAAKSLRKAAVGVTLVDKRNFHLFQPLLYQVATGGLSPGDIASPLRAVLKGARNIQILKAEVTGLDPAGRRVILEDGELGYDSLIVATGVSHDYFGHDDWAERAPGLKTVEDALAIRGRILQAFEAAEREQDPARLRSWLTFVIVGGGPTGVELAGAIGELANNTLRDEFTRFDPAGARVVLLEGTERVLPTFPARLSEKARRSLEKLGVEVQTGTLLKEIQEDDVTVELVESGTSSQLAAKTILWAAGIQASPLGRALADKGGAPLDRLGRVLVEPDLSLVAHPEIFVVGDLAHFEDGNGEPLPGVAQVAMQQGRYAARLITKRLKGESIPPFRYKDKGTLAVIGRNAAVADMGRWRFGGFLAWLIWIFIHITYLIEYDNKVLVLLQWAMGYFTRKRGARLITAVEIDN